jgi:hypothetical protein
MPDFQAGNFIEHWNLASRGTTGSGILPDGWYSYAPNYKNQD